MGCLPCHFIQILSHTICTKNMKTIYRTIVNHFLFRFATDMGSCDLLEDIYYILAIRRPRSISSSITKNKKIFRFRNDLFVLCTNVCVKCRRMRFIFTSNLWPMTSSQSFAIYEVAYWTMAVLGTHRWGRQMSFTPFLNIWTLFKKQKE